MLPETGGEGTREDGRVHLTAASWEPAQFIKLAGLSLVARALENEMPNGSVTWNLRLINVQSAKAPWRASGPNAFIFQMKNLQSRDRK